jgi:hypothetical protein
MRRSARVRPAVRALVLLGLALAASGWAAESIGATVTLGSDLATKPEDGATNCPNALGSRGCIAVNGVVPGRELAAPFGGVIVRWHLRLGAETAAQEVRIRVLRPVGATFKVISTGPFESIPAGAGKHAFPAALPIAAGDEVGIEGEAGRKIEWMAGLTGAEALLFHPEGEILDGTELVSPITESGFSDAEIAFNVEVESDCDHDGLGDETQDSDTSSCRPAPPPALGQPNAPSHCLVPNLKGKTLKAAKKRARKANCRIGQVKELEGITTKTGKVIKQKPKTGKVKAAGAKIAVTLG